MKRKLPKICGTRPIDGSYHGPGLTMNVPCPRAIQMEIMAAICHPPCICADCEQGFYTAKEQEQSGWWYRGVLSSEEAKQIAALHINSMQQDRQYLVERLASHGDIIINRWKKKSQEKRQSLLLEAIPNLCEKRWFIPRYTFTPEGLEIPRINDSGEMEARSSKSRCRLLMHWLNLEDWAAFDARQLSLSFLAAHFDVDFSAKCVVMHGLKYGEVVDWKADTAHRADILGFPKARLVLEAQAYLMSSLRKTVDGILEGIDTNTSHAAEKWKLMISMGFRHSNVVELWSPYTNQAFSSPPLFSIDNLISLAQIRLEAAADHLWLLQTEPAYMKRFIMSTCCGEVYELIKDMGGSWLVVSEIFAAIESCWRWGWIKSECEHVKGIHDRFRDSITQGENLPIKYDKALGALELLVVNEVNRRAALLGKATPSRPGFSRNFITTRKVQKEGPDVIETSRKAGPISSKKYLFENDPLDYCLHNLKASPDMQNQGIPFDHALIFSLVEHHLAKSDVKEKSRIDDVLSGMLSDLAACHEMLVAIRLHRPQSKARFLDEVVQSEDRKVWKVQKMEQFFTSQAFSKLRKELFRDFYEVQWPTGRKDMAWLDCSKNIRKALERFWQGLRMDSAMVWKSNGFNEAEVDDELEYISATSTQEYLNAIQAEEQLLLAKIESNQNSQNIQLSTIVATQTVWGPENPTSDLPTQIKSKEKTRPAEPQSPRDIQKIDNQIANTTIPSPEPHKIPIQKRAYEMLSRMYPASAEDACTKSMEWDNFVHAMTDLGFAARNKGGSAVGFSKEEACGDGEGGLRGGSRSIIFHRPHPVAKIDPLMLRCMGRRMTRRFGWGRGVFLRDDGDGDGDGDGDEY